MDDRPAPGQWPAHWRNAVRFVVLDTQFQPGGALPDSTHDFFSIWAAWRADPARPQQLHYLAVLDAAFSMPDLLRDYADAQQLLPLVRELSDALPFLVPGFHRLSFDGGCVQVTLMCGEVGACVSQLNACVDAFLLKAPASGDNAERTMAKLAGRLAAPSATLICRAASHNMQQCLEQAGFVFDPMHGPDANADDKSSDYPARLTARFSPRWAQAAPPAACVRKAIVIGAGLAGSAVCERLAARGWQVTLIERHAQPAQAASGNLAGIHMPLLSQDDNATARLTRAAYLYALRTWQQLGGIGTAFDGESCGVVQLARDAEHAQAQKNLIEALRLPAAFVQGCDATAAASLSGNPVAGGGLFFPQAGWAHPAGVCRALLARYAAQIETRFTHCATRLVRCGDAWQVFDAAGICIAQAPAVILANGMDALMFAQAAHLPLTAVRGQVTYVDATALPDLSVVVCRDGYITRPSQGLCSIGASYDADDEAAPRRSSDQENCDRIRHMLPDISLDLDRIAHQSRVAFRCVSTDRLPLVGALPDAAAPFSGERLRDVPRLPGLYGVLGYASRGLIWASFAAELLAAQLEHEPLPLESDLVDALDPARFLLKAARKEGRKNGGIVQASRHST